MQLLAGVLTTTAKIPVPERDRVPGRDDNVTIFLTLPRPSLLAGRGVE